jgi:hypothetical protein
MATSIKELFRGINDIYSFVSKTAYYLTKINIMAVIKKNYENDKLLKKKLKNRGVFLDIER